MDSTSGLQSNKSKASRLQGPNSSLDLSLFWRDGCIIVTSVVGSLTSRVWCAKGSGNPPEPSLCSPVNFLMSKALLSGSCGFGSRGIIFKIGLSIG